MYSEFSTGEQPQEDFHLPAGFMVRLRALLIDMIFLIFSVNVYFFFLKLIGNTDAMVMLSGALLISVFYFVYFHQSSMQATPGKHLCRIYIVREEDGRRISLLRSLVRYLIILIPTILIGMSMPPVIKEDMFPHKRNQAQGLKVPIFNDVAKSLSHQPKPKQRMTKAYTEAELQKLHKSLEVIEYKLDNEVPLSDKELEIIEKQKVLHRWREAIDFKKQQNIPLSEEDTIFLEMDKKTNDRRQVVVDKMYSDNPLTKEEKETLRSLQKDVSKEFMRSSWNALLHTAISTFYLVIIAFMVGQTQNHTGLHDIFSKTRVIRGRPPKYS